MTLRLTTYFGERDHDGRRFLAEALLDTYARHGVQVSALMRGAAGFGAKHHLHTDTLLTLSEDLPMVSIAVDTRERIEALIRRSSGFSTPAWSPSSPRNCSTAAR